MRITIIIGICILILLAGCSFTGCYDKCIEVKRGQNPEYIVKNCILWDTTCRSMPSQELKEICFEECKCTQD